MDELTPTSAQDATSVSSLRALIAARGRMICDDSRTLQSLLQGESPEQRANVDLLIRAQQARVPSDLIWHAVAPRADLGNRLMSRLQTQYSFSEQDALWSVSSWMDALDVQVSRPRVRTAPQLSVPEAVPSGTQEAVRTSDLGTASPAPVRTNTKVKEAIPLNVKQKTTSTRPAALPGWAIGAVAVVLIAAIGVMIYIATGPPANATRAPGVIYHLPPGYQAPTRAGHMARRLRIGPHPVRTTP